MSKSEWHVFEKESAGEDQIVLRCPVCGRMIAMSMCLDGSFDMQRRIILNEGNQNVGHGYGPNGLNISGVEVFGS